MARRTRLTAALLVALLTLGGPGMAIQAQTDLAGVYVCEGDNGAGALYRGTVELTAQGDAWNLQWTFEPEGAGIGIGLLEGTTLAVIFQTNSGLVGIAAYRLEQKDGVLRLIGRWTAPGADAIGSETLTRTRVQTPAQLRGPSRGV